MVGVRKVLVLVPEGLVPVPVNVRRARRHRSVVRVPMVNVVDMLMLVLHRLVLVQMAVVLGEVQPHAQAHEERGGDERPRHRVIQQDD